MERDVILEDSSDNKTILLNVFPAFGPQINPIKIRAVPSTSLGSIRNAISRLFKTNIHSQVILTNKGRELAPEDDRKQLKDLGIMNGSSLTFSLYTAPIPLKSASFYEAKDVEIGKEMLEKCVMHAEEHQYVEVAGVLIGKEKDEGKVLIIDSIPISEGDQKSVFLNPVRVASISEKLRGGENYLVGWYHSHVKPSSSASTIDARLQSGYQQLYPKTVALVLNLPEEKAEFYRVKGVPYFRMDKEVCLDIREPVPLIMEPASIKLITTIQERKEAEITNLSGLDAITGNYADFTVTVKNTGTVLLSNAKVFLSIFSPDQKESFSIQSDEINLPPSESRTYTLQCEIPASWPPGNAMVTATLKDVFANKQLCRLVRTNIRLLQAPVYDVKLSSLRTSQSVIPGQTATYLILVKNCGNRRDNIEVTWDNSRMPKGWKVKIYDGENEKTLPLNITLDAGSTHKFILRVTSPLTSQGGEQAPIVLKARSLSSVTNSASSKRT